MSTSSFVRVVCLRCLALAGILMIGCGGASAGGETTPAANRFGAWFEVFVPGAESDLVATVNGVPYHVHVRTTQVREMSGSTLASLAWTHGPEGGSQTAFLGPPSAVALAPNGAVRLVFNQSDFEIARLIASNDAYGPIADGATSARTSRGGTITRVQRGGGYVLCIEESTITPGQYCEDVCFARFCVAENGPVVELSGNWAPEQSLFRRDP